ncbi:MAG: phosphatase PAP2 family protein [Clostridia bacterium]|nr:phosphatase PAP2 family protein [Clostridia bacterium]
MEFLELLAGIRNGILDPIVLALTEFGGEMAFTVIAMVFLWCVDKASGFQMIFAWTIGSASTQLMKVHFRIPRPWVRDPSFTAVEGAIADAGGYSFPSGHSQTAASVFGFAGYRAKNVILKVVCYLLIPAVMFSRMYLGVHTPADVVVGAVCGLIPVALVIFLLERCGRGGRIAVYVLPVAISAVLLIYAAVSGLAPTDETFAEGLFNSGKLLGAAGAMVISAEYDRKKLNFSTDAVWYAQILKCVVGAVGLLAIRSGLKEVFALFTDGLSGNAFYAVETVLGGVRYFAMMIFAGILYPMTFKLWRKLGKK